ncbi:hypothetical protein [Paenibacillus sp. FSL R7-0026]|uniref:hypothetical protein n=1 Tax=Paenibacillus sp. FSL R7-0026 TaxID=2921668 RepID=UPI0030F54408
MKLTKEQADTIRLIKDERVNRAWVLEQHVREPRGWVVYNALNGMDLHTLGSALFGLSEDWETYECECGFGYAIRQIPDDEIEEPACPHCGGTNAELQLTPEGYL